jgi:hypothetical protein
MPNPKPLNAYSVEVPGAPEIAGETKVCDPGNNHFKRFLTSG